MIYAVNKRTKEHQISKPATTWDGYEWDLVKADADGWIEWSGGECPLPDTCRADLKVRGEKGIYISKRAGAKRWCHDGQPYDIIAYRPILDDTPQAPEDCVTVRYDLDPANVEGAIRDKLIEMGWTPPQDGLPEWNGKGLPPVGTMCECMTAGRRTECEVVAHRNGYAVAWVAEGKRPCAPVLKAYHFRPIRTDREKWVNQAAEVALQTGDALGNVYDALKSGELPQPLTPRPAKTAGFFFAILSSRHRSQSCNTSARSTAPRGAVTRSSNAHKMSAPGSYWSAALSRRTRRQSRLPRSAVARVAIRQSRPQKSALSVKRRAKMFKDYESKPITRRAYQLKEGDVFDKVGEATYRITINGETLDFKAYEPVKPGDYIVYLNAEDIYHCNAKVFAERNIVE